MGVLGEEDDVLILNYFLNATNTLTGLVNLDDDGLAESFIQGFPKYLHDMPWLGPWVGLYRRRGAGVSHGLDNIPFVMTLMVTTSR
jgi:hypothetical protein